MPGGLRWPHAWKRRPAVGRTAAARTERGAQRGAGRAPARERAERGVQLRGTERQNAESGRGGRAREEDREHGAAATGRHAGAAPMRRMIRMGELGVRAVEHTAARDRGHVTTSHNNPTRAWSRNTIHPLFPLDSLGAGIIIGAGPGGRCSLRAPRRQGKRGGRREARAATPLPGAGTVTER